MKWAWEQAICMNTFQKSEAVTGLIKQWWLQNPTVFSEIFRNDGKATDHFIAGYYVFHKSENIHWLCYYSVLNMELMCAIRWNIIKYESWELSNGELIMNTEKKGPWTLREERHQKNVVSLAAKRCEWLKKKEKEKSGKSWQILEKSSRMKSENPEWRSFLPL